MLQAAALAPVVETGESEDVRTRVRLHCDSTGLCRAQIWRSGTHARKQCEIWAQFRPNPVRRRIYILKRFSLLPLKEVKRIEHLQLEIIYMLHEKMTYTLHTRCEVTS